VSERVRATDHFAVTDTEFSTGGIGDQENFFSDRLERVDLPTGTLLLARWRKNKTPDRLPSCKQQASQPGHPRTEHPAARDEIVVGAKNPSPLERPEAAACGENDKTS
jgi:hypothetical protein